VFHFLNKKINNKNFFSIGKKKYKNVKNRYYRLQSVSEMRVLILTSEGALQFMKLFSITFCKIRKSIPRFFAPQFLPNESFCVIN
jgi:hypothetical protein